MPPRIQISDLAGSQTDPPLSSILTYTTRNTAGLVLHRNIRSEQLNLNVAAQEPFLEGAFFMEC